MLNMLAKEYIDQLYHKVNESPDILIKAGFAYGIIEIKRDNPELVDYGNSIYVDVKDFVDWYIMGISSDSNGDYGYDSVSIEKVLNALNIIDNINQRVALYDRTLNLLKSYSMDCLSEIFKQERKRYKLQQCFRTKSLSSWIRGIGRLSIYNVWTVIGVLFIAFCGYYVLTLPMADEKHALFVIEHQDYCGNIYANHFLTYFAGVLDLTDKTFCKANSVLGFFIMIAYKLFFMLFGGWNAVDIIREKLSLQNGND